MDKGLESFTLREILRIFYLNKIFFIVFPILLMVPAYIGYESVTPTYRASVKMYVKASQKSVNFYDRISSLDIIADHSQLATSNIVLNRVVEALKLYEIPADYAQQYATPMKRFFMKKNNNILKTTIGYEGARELLISEMSILPAGGSNMFTFQVQNFNPTQAVIIANSLSRSYIIFDLEMQIEELKLKYGEKNSSVLQLEDYISEYKKYLNGEVMPDLEAMGPATIKIIAQAESAYPQVRVSFPLLMSFAFFAGIFLAAVCSALVEYYSNTFKSPKEVVKNLNMPFIGSIPKQKKQNELIMSDENLSHSSLECVSSFQRFGDKILLLSKKQNIKTILITAFNEINNTTALIANLAIYLSRDAGKKVIIIDANLKYFNPLLADTFKISGNSGLPDVFESKKTLEEAVVKAGKNLDILLSHTVSYRPISLLDTSFMSDLVKEVRDKYDFVLIDCTADLKKDSEPVILASYTDAVILIVNEGLDRFQDVQIAIKNLNQSGERVLFSVLNNRKKVMPKMLYKIS